MPSRVFSHQCAASLLCLIFGAYSASVLGFWFGTFLNVPLLVVGISIGWLSSAFLPGQNRESGAWKLRLPGMLGALAAWVVLHFLFRDFVDTSFDSISYHAEAGIRLATGWNPFRPDPFRELHDAANWKLEYYPKFAWILEAAVLQLTGSFSGITQLGAALMLSALLLTYSTLGTHFKMGALQSAVLAATICLNPVSCHELLSFYVDGIMATSFLCFAICSVRYAIRPSKAELLLASICLIAALNSKATALVYSGFLGVAFAVALGRLRGFSTMIRWSSALLCAWLVGVGVYGYSPYARDYFQARSVPALEWVRKKPELLAPERPPNQRTMSAPFRFAHSLFSRFEGRWTSENGVASPVEAQLKLPMSWYSTESESMRHMDPRAGGFGPWFSAALLGAIALLGLQLRGGDRERRWVIACLGWALLGSALANPESWWAKFIPLFGYLPSAIVLLDAPSGSGRGFSALRFGSAFLLIVNGAALLILGSQGQWSASRDFGQKIRNFEVSRKEVRICDRDGNPTGLLQQLLQRSGIPVRAVSCAEVERAGNTVHLTSRCLASQER